MDELQRVTKQVVIGGTKKGLGIRIVGGRTIQLDFDDDDKKPFFGIFIKEIIKNSLAEKEGTLKRGDQILEANGQSLVGVSNEKAVEILKSCAATNEITLTISRDSKSMQDFRRLSNSLLLQNVDSLPKATSTPRSAQAVVETGARQNGDDRDGKDSSEEAKRFSTSSELTQISTTDISSHGDDLDDNELIDQAALNKNLQRHISQQSQRSSIGLSDVVLEEAKGANTMEASLSLIPPPLPSSPPPNETEEELGTASLPVLATNVTLRDRSSPEGKAVSPPPSAGLSSSLLQYVTHTFIVPKGSGGLGIIVGGGEGKPDGPHIVIDRVLDGMDAAKDGRLKHGDRIVSINGEDFRRLKRERALTTLSRIKADHSISNYNITVERKRGEEQSGGQPTVLPSPQRNSNSAIFNSDTLLASEAAQIKSSLTESIASNGVSPSKKPTSTPLRYSAKRDSDRKKDKARHDSVHARLSMDPIARCKLSKLEWALKYMGYDISPQQQKEMRQSLDVDEQGKVVFQDFVKLAQEMFSFKLDDSRLETNLMLALTQKEDFEMPPMPRKSTSYEHIWDQSPKSPPFIKPASSQPILPLAPSSNSIHSETELELMRQKLHDLGRDKEQLKADVALEKEKKLTAHLKKELKRREEELKRMKNKSTISEEDEEVLLKRIEMTEDAHRAERSKSNLMEDEMRRITAELDILRKHNPADMPLEELRKRLAILDNELSKEKSISRRYQVATERLMQFVENCHEVLVKSPEVDRIMYHPHGKGASVQRGNMVTGNPRPPQYLSKHAKFTASKLACEAKETMDAVRKMMQIEVLPFNWQEAYTEDGRKYYINHETQQTSWVHPVTKVTSSNHGSSTRSESRSSTQSLPSAPVTPRHTHQ